MISILMNFNNNKLFESNAFINMCIYVNIFIIIIIIIIREKAKIISFRIIGILFLYLLI